MRGGYVRFGSAWTLLLLLVGLTLPYAAPALAPAPPLPKLGAISGGDKSVNHRWESNGSSKFFSTLLQERLPKDSGRTLNVELIAIRTKKNGLLATSGKTATASIRYEISDTVSGTVLFDQVVDSSIVTGSAEFWTTSQLETDGFKSVLKKSLEQFLALYATNPQGASPAIRVAPGQASTAAQSAVSTAGSVSSTVPNGPAPLPAIGQARTIRGARLSAGTTKADIANGACFVIESAHAEGWSFFTKNRDGFAVAEISPGSDCEQRQAAVKTVTTKNQGGIFYSGFGYSYQITTTFIGGKGFYTVYFAPRASNNLDLTVTRQKTKATEVAPTELELRYQGAALDGTASTTATSAGATVRAGESFRDCTAICPEMVALPAGSFLMGSTSAEADRHGNEGPVHEVVFARPFAIAKYEVSYDEWAACVADGVCTKPPVTGWGEGRRPVVNIRWTDARVYADWLSRKTGHRYFLPSESEWEYAARAGTVTPWNTGEAILTDDANILGQFKQVVPVGGFPPNAFGLYDMHGNAREWVLDCADVGYFGVPDDGGAANRADCDTRIVRGGGFNSDPANARSAARFISKPTVVSGDTGLRIARAM